MNDTLLIIVLTVAALSFITALAAVIILASNMKTLKRNQDDARKKNELIPLLYQRMESSSDEQRRAEHENAQRFSEFSQESLKAQLTAQKDIARALQDLQEKNYNESRRNAEILRNELEKIRGTVDEKLNETLTSRLDASFRTVSQQLENVYRSLGEMKELSVNVTDNVSGLNRILSNVKARGTWGEAQLRNILDDIVPTLYETNVATNPDSQKRVEFAVKMHTGLDSTVFLPIDSKFPIEDYARLCKATDDGDIALMQDARKALRIRLLSEARSVSEYIHEPETAPFAVLYLATEGLYAELASDEELTSKIRSDYKVLICGPTTVAALLNSLAMGMRTVEINRKAEEIRQLLAMIRDQYGRFTSHLAKVRKKLSEAEDALDEAEKRNRIITKKLERAELGNSESDIFSLPESDDSFDVSGEDKQEDE
ncbi:MAG: DNA recombination protein RmuC [Clostridia bacterium]|nr:DNA recombination protein RmuC [Clostridia bacterium]